MIKVAVFEEHRPNEDGADRRDGRHPSQFLEREIHILQRQYGGGEEPLRCRFAEVGDPIVVGARERIGDVRVTH